MKLLDLGTLRANQTAATADSGLLSSAIEYDTAQQNAVMNALEGRPDEVEAERQVILEEILMRADESSFVERTLTRAPEVSA